MINVQRMITFIGMKDRDDGACLGIGRAAGCEYEWYGTEKRTARMKCAAGDFRGYPDGHMRSRCFVAAFLVY